MGQIVYKKVGYTGSGGGEGSNVQYESELTEGVKVGALTIDGTKNDILVPPQEDEIIEITKSEYDKLTPDEKQDKTFCINDWTPDETLGGSYNGPIGEIISYMGTIAPTNFLICDGSIYNISDYIDLANHINKHFGSFNFFGGDGTTTFAVPDLRGEFLRGSGTNGHEGQGNGSTVGKHQNATTHVRLEMEETNRTLRYASGTSGFIDAPDSLKESKDGGFYFSNIGTAYNYGQWGGFTSRPTNTSVLYCIRYREAGSNNGSNTSLEDKIICTSFYTGTADISINSTTASVAITKQISIPAGKYRFWYDLPAYVSFSGYQLYSFIASGNYTSENDTQGNYCDTRNSGSYAFSGVITFDQEIESINLMIKVSNNQKTIILPAYTNFPITFIKLD